MNVFLWIVVGVIGVVIVFFISGILLFRYVNSPKTHDATAINEEKSNQYYTKKGKVVYVRYGNFFNIGEKEILGADVGTFEVLDSDFAKDKNSVYYNGAPIDGADPTSATSIPNANLDPTQEGSSGFLKDAHTVFCGSQSLDTADPNTFTALWGVYGMDTDFVYYYNTAKIPKFASPTMVPKASTEVLRMHTKIFYAGELMSTQADSFVIMEDDYSKDASAVYRYGKILEGVDAESFKIVSPYYRKDKNTAYYFDFPIIGSDPNTFKIFNDYFSRDSQHVYYTQFKVQDMNPSDFTSSRADKLAKAWEWRPLQLNETNVKMAPRDEVVSITNYYHSYKNEVYSNRQKEEGLKPSDVIVLDEENKLFTRIHDAFFYFGTPIPNVDPETFVVLSEHFSKDKNQVFWCQHPVIDAEPNVFKYTLGLGAEENEQGEYTLVQFDSDLF